MKKVATLVLGMLVSHLSVNAFDKSTFTQQPSPLSFEENHGQVIDQNGASRPDIQYKLSTPGMSVFVGSGQLHYQFYKMEKNPLQLQRSLPVMKGRDIELPPIVHTYRMDVTLQGANEHAQVITENIIDGYINYYTGNCGEAGAKVRSYKKITYKDIYPGIDWVLYVKGNTLEYDFVVHPTGNVADIALKYDGANSLEMSENGGLSATTIYGNISEQAPYAYQLQDKKEIYTRFQLQGNTATFAPANYTGTLVIDPTVEWATYYGGEAHTTLSAAQTSNSNCVYVTGRSNSTTNIATVGAYQQTLHGSHCDAIIAKFDKDGHRIWATYYGGAASYPQVLIFPGHTEGTSIDVDNKHGYLYVAGATNATTNIATPGAHQDTLALSVVDNPLFGANASMDAFLVKFDTSGNRVWGTYYGDDSSDEGLFIGEISVAYDAKNDKVDLASWSNKTGRATGGTHQSVFGGYQPSQGWGDALITQFNSNGTRQWATYYGGDSADISMDISVDTTGSIYVAGLTMSPESIASAGAHQTIMSASGEKNGVAFLAKLSSNGTRQWGTYYGDYGEWGNSVACNKFGQVYLAGYTTTRQLAANPVIATPGAWQVYNAGVNGITPGNQDAYLVQFNSEGIRKWGTYYGGEDADFGYGVTCDNTGYAYLTGSTTSRSVVFPGRIATIGSYQDTLAGELMFGNSVPNDAFLAQFDSAGRRTWGSYYGGMGADEGKKGLLGTLAVACDKENSIYLAGGTFSTSGIATPGSYQDTFAYGGTTSFPLDPTNGFIAKFTRVDLSVALVGLLDTACAGNRELAVELRNNGILWAPPSNYTTITYIYYNHRTGLGDTLTNSPLGLQPLTSRGVSFGNVTLDTGTYTFYVYMTQVKDDGIPVNDSMTMVVYLKDCPAAGINALNNEDKNINIYPNPAMGTLYINTTNNIALRELTIYNVVGATVYTETLNTSAAVKPIDVSSLIQGYYVLRIATEYGYINKPFQVIR